MAYSPSLVLELRGDRRGRRPEAIPGDDAGGDVLWQAGPFQPAREGKGGGFSALPAPEAHGAVMGYQLLSMFVLGAHEAWYWPVDVCVNVGCFLRAAEGTRARASNAQRDDQRRVGDQQPHLRYSSLHLPALPV